MEAGKKLERSFYLRDGCTVAKDLLGKKLVHRTPEGIRSGMIVEVEAYMGAADAAAHSYKGLRGSRTEIQYGEGGYAYIYLIYGMHYCFNVVANQKERPEAVLVRALEPIDGIESMLAERKTKHIRDLCNGPGKLCRTLHIDKSHYGIDLCKDVLYIEIFRTVEPKEILATPRIHIDYAGEAKEYLWRYILKGNDCISHKAD